MTFVIDLGAPERAAPNFDKLQVLRDAAADSLPIGATPAEIDAALARLIVRDLLAPKRAETSRAHFLAFWPLLSELAGRSPASFDFVVNEFSEHLAGFG